MHALYLAARDPRVPWYAKAVALAVAAYAFSPIDLIPDFIPVIGYLDDLIIVPLGILLAVRLIPADVLAEHRSAASEAAERPTSRTAATRHRRHLDRPGLGRARLRVAVLRLLTRHAQLVWRRPNETA